MEVIILLFFLWSVSPILKHSLVITIYNWQVGDKSTATKIITHLISVVLVVQLRCPCHVAETLQLFRCNDTVLENQPTIL